MNLMGARGSLHLLPFEPAIFELILNPCDEFLILRAWLMVLEVVALCDQLTRLRSRVCHEFCDNRFEHLIHLVSSDPSPNDRVGGLYHQFGIRRSLPAVHLTSTDPWDIQVGAVDCCLDAPQD